MSDSEWKEVRLGDEIELLYGKSLVKTKRNDKGNVPVYGSNGIVGFHDEPLVNGPGVIIGRKGTVGSINYSSRPFYPIDTTYYLDPQNNDLKFMYYFMHTVGLSTMNTHSAVPGLNRDNVYNLIVRLPELSEQKLIAATLSALDDMIELNNKINKTLEEMAQAIFKSWFVDFEPFRDEEFEESELGLIPKGWRVGCIGDYVKVKSGFAFKSSWWETSGVPVIKIKEIDNYTINFGDVSYVSEDKAALAKDFRVNGGDLLIAMTGATIGKFAIVPKMPSFAVVNQRVGKFFLGDNPLEKLGFIYCILKQDNVYKEIVSRGEGSAQPNISPSGIESIKIVLPPERLINEYNQLVMKFFKMIIENTAENALLICLRDTLLPKLMSGEIRVPVEEVV